MPRKIDEYLNASRRLLPVCEPELMARVTKICSVCFSALGLNPEIIVIRSSGALCEYVTIENNDYVVCDVNMLHALRCLSAIYLSDSQDDAAIRDFTTSFLLDRLEGYEVGEPVSFWAWAVSLLSRWGVRTQLETVKLPDADRGLEATTLRVVLMPMIFAICHELSHVAIARHPELREQWLKSARAEVRQYRERMIALSQTEIAQISQTMMHLYGIELGPEDIEDIRNPDQSSSDSHLTEEIACDMLASTFTLQLGTMQGLTLKEAAECIHLALRHVRALEYVESYCDGLVADHEREFDDFDALDSRFRLGINRTEISERCGSFAVLALESASGEMPEIDTGLFRETAKSVAAHLVDVSNRYEHKIDDYYFFRMKTELEVLHWKE